MTDTGPVPGEGLPESTGAEAVPQPHSDHSGETPGPTGHHWSTDAFLAPATPAYTFLDQPEAAGQSGLPGGEYEDDMLLMPGPQGSWGGDPQFAPPSAPEPPFTEDLMSRPSLPLPPRPQPPQPMPLPEQPVGMYQPPMPPEAFAAGPVGAEPLAGPHPPVEPVHMEPVAMEPITMEPLTVEPIAMEPLPPQAPAVEPIAAEPPFAGPELTGPVGMETVTLRSPVLPPEPAAAEAPRVPAPAVSPEGGQNAPARRPLNLGPPQAPGSGEARPESGVSVRSLADRGPTPPPAPPVTAPAPEPQPEAVQPEAAAVPDAAAEATGLIPAQSTGEAPVSGGPWGADGGPAAPPQPAEPTPPPADAASPGPAVAEAVTPEPTAAEQAAVPELPQQLPADEPGGLADLDRAPVAAEIVASQPAAEEGAPQPEPVPEPPAELPPPAAESAPAAEESAPEAEPAPPAPPVEPVAEPAVEAEAATAEPEPESEPAAEPVEAEPEAVAAEEPAAEAAPEAEAEAAAESEPEPEAVDEPAAEPAAEAEAPPVQEPAEEEAARQEAEPEPSPEPALLHAGYEPAVRDAVHRVIRERRDIRNGFRQDPIPPEVLLRVLEAAHTAPSVGHSQPWDFVVIRSDKTREKMHELAMRQRDAYASSLPKARAKQFRELKIEAILETPVNIVVTADPTRGGRHTLGRHTQPQMAPYSSALAVENLWLAARAEGLGVGWVSFFDEREMVRELGLPEHLEVVAYLCVGYVDEFPQDPELVQAGWSKRRPLSWVVHEEEYGNRALPGEEPHDLLDETLRGIRPLDAKALGEAWERQKRMTKPSGALGMLEIISAQLSGLSRQCPPPIPEPAAVAIFAGDHGVHAQGVTSWPQEVTAQMVANFLGGGAVCNAFANQVGAEVCVIDVGVAAELPTTPGLLPRKVRMGTDDFTVGPAMSRAEVLRAIEVGIETARDLVAAGNKVLLTGEMGIANTTASAAMISVYTGADPAEVTGRGTGINDEMHARKVDVVRRALELHHPDPADPIGVLSAIGGLEHAAMVGLLLGGASLRTPVILDGVSAGAAALVARAIAPEALAACIAGHRSAEPGHVAALTKLGLRPLVDLDLRLGEGTGALLALPLVQSAARVMHEVATFDAAGVTEKG